MKLKVGTRIKRGKKIFSCVKVVKTKEQLKRWLFRVQMQMFDDQSYRVIRGDNGTGIFVEVIHVTPKKHEMTLMGEP